MSTYIFIHVYFFEDYNECLHNILVELFLKMNLQMFLEKFVLAVLNVPEEDSLPDLNG